MFSYKLKNEERKRNVKGERNNLKKNVRIVILMMME